MELLPELFFGQEAQLNPLPPKNIEDWLKITEYIRDPSLGSRTLEKTYYLSSQGTLTLIRNAIGVSYDGVEWDFFEGCLVYVTEEILDYNEFLGLLE